MRSSGITARAQGFEASHAKSHAKRTTRLLGSCLAAAVACGAPDDAPVPSDPIPTPAPSAGMGSAGLEPMMPSGCSAPATAPAAPNSIAEVVALLNALPKPTSLPCLLEALAHPLSIQAAYSVFSAQPADGARSPRIFLFFDPLVLSVVPAGGGAHLLEFGERRDEMSSLKAELEFPIANSLSPTSPFDRLRFDDNTTTSTCGFCHSSEQPAEGIDHPFARVSQAMRPMPSQRISVATLQNEAAICDAAREPERCAMLRAIFGAPQSTPGAIERDFPTTYKLFF